MSGPRRAAPDPPGGGSPWQYAKHLSSPALDPEKVRLTRRSSRYDLLHTLWSVSQVERFRACRRRPHGGGDGATGDVVIKNNAGVAHFTGLETCGSIWSCPVCSATIRNTRALLVSHGAGNWVRGGGSVWFVTFTAPHHLGMPLGDKQRVDEETGEKLTEPVIMNKRTGEVLTGKDGKPVMRPVVKPGLLSVIAGSFSQVIAGSSWLGLKERCDIVGNIRSLEITHGENGWHPHLHVLVFCRGDLSEAQQQAMTRHFRRTWQRAITAAGYKLPSDQHGVVIEKCVSAEEAGAYIAKTQDSGVAVGNELARADLKTGRAKGRTPFQILADYRAYLVSTGDRTVTGDLALWGEYETVTRGHQCITWSKGLRVLLGVGAEQEKTDEELAAAEVGGDDVITLDRDTWRSVTYVPGLPARLLEAAERGGRLGVLAVLRKHGLDADPDPRSFTANPVSSAGPWRARVADADWSHGR